MFKATIKQEAVDRFRCTGVATGYFLKTAPYPIAEYLKSGKECWLNFFSETAGSKLQFAKEMAAMGLALNMYTISEGE